MDGLPVGPWFPRDVGFKGTGVDFLGLRAVNMRLIDACLPGISNVTYSIRPYSVATWMWWKARELLNDGDAEGRMSAELRAFAERVETLFAWGHRVRGYPGAPGSRSGPPQGGAVSLTFASWKRSAANTSIMAAVRYGPSVKNTNGLGFLQAWKAGTFAVTEAGNALAAALDAELKPLGAYHRLLNGLKPVRGREADALELVDAWRVEEASEGEVAAFRAAFHAPAEIAGTERRGRRSGTLELVLHVLHCSPAPMAIDELRRALADRRLPDGSLFDVPEELAMVRERWLVMQVRQLQRLTLEALLTWSEEMMLRRGRRSLETMRTSLREAITSSTAAPPEAPWRDVLKAALAAHDGGEAAPETALFEVWDRLAAALAGGDGDGIIGAALAACACVQSAVDGLLERAAERDGRRLDERIGEGAAAEDEIRAACQLGEAERLSLAHFRDWVAERMDAPAATAAIELLETHVLSRHLAVGVGRFDGERQRLRFTLEEEGLAPLIGAPLVPSVTEDRLAALLSLMVECGYLRRHRDNRLSEV